MPTSDAPETPDTFRAAVDGEIEVLLRLWQEDTDTASEPVRGRYFSAAGKRLSELGRNAPDVVRPVLAHMNDALSEHVALLLRRAGPRAIDVAVACAFDADAHLARSARLVLAKAIATAADQSLHHNYAHLPLRQTLTLILDALVRGPHDNAARAAFLIDLLSGCDDDATLVLLASALRCCGDAGFEAILARWHAETAAGEASHAALGVVGRFGTPFLAAMSRALDSAAAPEGTAVLVALDVASSFIGGAALFREPEHPTSLELRVSGRLRRNELDAAVLEDVLTRLAPLIDDPDATIRDRAVALVGRFGDAPQAALLQPVLGHAVASTRMAAIAGLRALEDRGCIPGLLEIARSDPEPAARRLALQSLGQLGAAEALDLLLELVHDDAVASQAILALGELGDDARAPLEELLRGADKKVARMASRALFGGRRTPRPESDLRRERLAKVRGADARPLIPVSVVAAIRHLPDLRPYPEVELTRLIGEVCHDFSTTRRELVMGSPGQMVRADGVYELSETGRAVWRVERWLREHDPRQRRLAAP